VNGDDREDMVFLYLADALDPAERDEVEAWIASGAPDVEVRLARAELEVARLAAMNAPVAPSPAVRDRLLARIAQAEAPTVAAAPPPRRAAFRDLGRLALAAGIAGIVSAGVVGVLARRAIDARDATRFEDFATAQQELAGAQQEIADAQEEIAELEARHRSLESDLVLAGKAIMVLRSDEMQSLALVGTQFMPKAQGRVFWDWANWYCYMHAEGFAADPNRTYAMWLFTEDGSVIAVGSFHADARGEVTFLSPVPHDVGHVVRAGVSLEPDEDLGSKPRGEVVMVGSTT
jgi:hypothetical protein